MPVLKPHPLPASRARVDLSDKDPGFHDLATCSLAELESVLPSAFYPITAHIFLQISLPWKLDFILERHPDAALQAWVQAHTREAEGALLRFLGNRGLLIAYPSPPKAAEVPLPLICDIPMTGELNEALAFGLDLFRQSCGSKEAPDLRCCYFEYAEGHSPRKDPSPTAPPMAFVGVM